MALNLSQRSKKLTIKFPQQIDSFSIKSPNEIVQSAHINDLQDVIVAIEVFAKSLEESLGSHLDAGSAHTSVEIAVAAIAGLDTTNLQTTLESLKTNLESAIASLESTTEDNLEAHRVLDIDLAHPNGTFPGSRITDNSISGSKIQSGAITLDKLGFDLATQAELDTHSSLNIASAHPNGLFPISRLDTDVATQVELDAHTNADIANAHPNGLFPIARLDTDVATQAELNAHTNASSDVHGIGSTSSVVGTKTSQVLENKKIVSRFEGTKALFFEEEVLDVEVDLYNLTSIASPQFEVRERAVWEITGVDHSGLTTILTLSASNKFDDVVGLSNQIDFFDSASGTIYIGTVQSIPTGNQIELTTNEPFITTGWFVRNKKKAIPLFTIDQNGSVKIKQLEIENGLTNIVFQESLELNGDLDVQGRGDFGGSLNVVGNISNDGYFQTSGLSSNNSQVTITSPLTLATNLTLANNLQVGGNLTSNGNQTLTGNLQVGGNERVDGYLSVGKYLSITESLFVGGNITTSGGVQAQELDLAGDARLGGGFYVEGYSSLDNDLFVNGDVTITGQINVSGLGTVIGPATSTDNALARYDGYSGIFILDSLAILDDSGLLFVPNVDSYGIVVETTDAYDALVINKSGSSGYALRVENLVDAYTSPFVIDGYGYVGLGTLAPTRRLEVFGDSYYSDQLKPVKGSANAPIYSFDGDLDTGIWSSAGNSLDFAVNGTNQLNINSTNIIVTNDLVIDGGDLTTSSASFNLLNSVTNLTIGDTTSSAIYNFATGSVSSGNTKTINIGSNGASGSTTAINIGSANGSTTTILGNLVVSGTTTTINTTNLEVLDNNIRLNKGGLDSSAINAGVSIEGTSATTLANLLYDSTLASRFKIGADGYESEILTSSTTQTIVGSKTFNAAIAITPTGNQLVLGSTNTTTINAATPTSSRIYTISDVGTNANFLLSEGSQTINGTKTFAGSTIIETSSTLAALRITQTGSGNALLVEDSANPDSSSFVINQDGYVGIQTLLPIYELDAYGRARADFFLTNSESLTISGGSVSVAKGLGIITGGGTTLSTINGMSNGQQVVLINNSGGLVTVTNAGNISTGTGRDFRFADTSAALLVFSSTTGKAHLLGGGGGSDAWEVRTSSGSVVVSVKYFADTTGGPISLTFPSSAQTGDTIVISDPLGTWGTNAVTLIPGSGSQRFKGGTPGANLLLNIANKTYTFVYYSSASNWVLLQAPTSYGG